MSDIMDHDPHGRHQPRKAAASGWIGSALEYYDFFIYATAASLVFPQLFFPSGNPTVAIVASLATYGVGYVSRPIGAFVLGLASAAPLIRYVRSSMLEVIHQPFISVARAKGVSERVVMFRHAARNALIPVITVIALALPNLLGGTVIIETIFAWPGMGQLAITAVRGMGP